MSETPRPAQPSPGHPEPHPDHPQSQSQSQDPTRASQEPTSAVDPHTGEDLSWKQTPLVLVLLDRPAPDHRELGDLLTEVFEDSYEVERGSDDDPATAVYVEDATVIVSTIDAPVADGEASRYARELAMWNGTEAVVDTHRSQVVVAAFRWGPIGDDGEPTEPEYLDPRIETLRCELAAANVAAALTALPGAVAVSVGGAAATLPAGPYRGLVAGNPIPAPALVGVRAGMQSESTSCAYTTGLGRFGRMDLERLDADVPPAAVYGQMCDLVAYSLGSGTILQPGQALEVGGPQPLLTSAEISPFTGQPVLRLTPGAAEPGA